MSQADVDRDKAMERREGEGNKSDDSLGERKVVLGLPSGSVESKDKTGAGEPTNVELSDISDANMESNDPNDMLDIAANLRISDEEPIPSDFTVSSSTSDEEPEINEEQKQSLKTTLTLTRSRSRSRSRSNSRERSVTPTGSQIYSDETSDTTVHETPEKKALTKQTSDKPIEDDGKLIHQKSPLLNFEKSVGCGPNKERESGSGDDIPPQYPAPGTLPPGYIPLKDGETPPIPVDLFVSPEMLAANPSTEDRLRFEEIGRIRAGVGYKHVKAWKPVTSTDRNDPRNFEELFSPEEIRRRSRREYRFALQHAGSQIPDSLLSTDEEDMDTNNNKKSPDADKTKPKPTTEDSKKSTKTNVTPKKVTKSPAKEKKTEKKTDQGDAQFLITESKPSDAPDKKGVDEDGDFRLSKEEQKKKNRKLRAEKLRKEKKSAATAGTSTGAATVSGPVQMARKNGRLKYEPKYHVMEVISGAVMNEITGRWARKEPEHVYEREWYPCYGMGLDSSGNMKELCQKPPAGILIKDFYPRTSIMHFKVKAYSRSDVLNRHLLNGKAVRELIPNLNSAEDVAWTAEESEDEDNMMGQTFPDAKKVMAGYNDEFLDMMDLVATEEEMKNHVSYSRRWEEPNEEATRRVRWAADSFVPGQRCPFLVCRMEKLHAWIGIRTYRNKERFLRHLCELHTPAVRLYQCFSRDTKTHCQVMVNRLCELARHQSVAGLDMDVPMYVKPPALKKGAKPKQETGDTTEGEKAEDVFYSTRHGIGYPKIWQKIIKGQQVSKVVKNIDWVSWSSMPKDTFGEYRKVHAAIKRDNRKRKNEDQTAGVLKTVKGNDGKVIPKESASKEAEKPKEKPQDAPIPEINAWERENPPLPEPANLEVVKTDKVKPDTATELVKETVKHPGTGTVAAIKVIPPKNRLATRQHEFKEELLNVTETLKGQCRDQLLTIRQSFTEQVDMIYGKVEVLMKRHLDEVVSTMEPVIGGAQKSEIEIESLTKQLKECRIEKEFHKAKSEDKSKQIEELEKRLFALDVKDPSKMKVKKSVDKPSATELGVATPTPAQTSATESQGAEGGGTPMDITEKEKGGADNMSSVLADLFKKGTDQQKAKAFNALFQSMMSDKEEEKEGGDH